MWPYLLMFSLPSLAALHDFRSERAAGGLRAEKATLTWVAIWLLLTVIIGYRFRVGGDWFNYFRYLDAVRGAEFDELLFMSDPAYQILNWISVEMNWGIYGVNLIGGAIFAFGLIAFCSAQPFPWLALAVAVPYCVIVVGMGYTRQAIALGLEMLGLLSLINGSTLRFVAWMALAALFHKTAVLILPIAALAGSRNRYWTAVWVGTIVVVLYYLLLANDAESLVANYVDSDVESEGALPRLLMNAAPGAILLNWRSKFSFKDSEASLWKFVAIISLVMLVLFLLKPSASTALDRMAIYIMPLQMVVFSRLPVAFGTSNNASPAQPHSETVPRTSQTKVGLALVAGVVVYYGIAQLTWLNFATNAYSWIPYQFYFLDYVN